MPAISPVSKPTKEQQGVEMYYLAESVGEFIEFWGFKKIQGVLWAHLYLSKNAWDAAEIMEALNISKSLTSQTLGVLTEYRVIIEVEKSAKGTRQYMANPDPMAAILYVLKTRERRMLAKISSAQKLARGLPKKEISEQGMDLKRLEKLGNLVKMGELILNQIPNFALPLSSITKDQDER